MFCILQEYNITGNINIKHTILEFKASTLEYIDKYPRIYISNPSYKVNYTWTAIQALSKAPIHESVHFYTQIK